MAPGLSPEDYQRASDLFNELHDVPDADLPAALEAKCAAECQGSAAVRSEVVRLLKADRGAGAFLGNSAFKDASRLLHERVPETIAHYKLLSKLGEGGMGEVWRAHDSKLERDVAIKILPPAFAADPDRMARFSREAQVLASLSHPNIAVIYGVEDRALIMELVEGPTLAERIARGPIPWDEAAEIACQIASALEAAHERGVVHRDLKPANVKITPEGHVRVLDFGLAKPRGKDPVSGEPSSPTIVAQGSMAGMILGTAAYMAPEQAKGKAADRRADIWAFGVVLVEMLTGRNPFQCESVPETLSAVLNADPDLTRIPGPARTIVERGLRKDPRRRWQSIADARIAIEEALAGGEPIAPLKANKPWFVRRGAAVAAAAVLISAGLFLRRENPQPAPMQFTVNSPDNGSFPLLPPLRVSPSGDSIAFLAADPADGVSRVYLYDLAKGTTRALGGTDRTSEMYWSADSHSLLLTRNGAVFQMEIHGDSPQPLPFESGYSSWGPDGVITATRAGLSRFHPESGDARLILKNEPGNAHIYIYPTLIPGSRSMLFNAYNGSPIRGFSVRMGSTDGAEQKQLFVADNCALYAETPSGRGYALYLRGFTVNAQELDPSSGKLRGDPHPVAGPVDQLVGSGDPGAFSASNNGVLAFRRRGVTAEYRVVRFSRTGTRLGTVGGVADYSNPALSPDGKRLAVGIRRPMGKRDIWVFDLPGGSSSPAAFDDSDNYNPVWSPDGKRLAFSSDRRGSRDIYVKDASGIGDAELIVSSHLGKSVEDWSRDGRWLVYNEAVPDGIDDLVAVSLETRKPIDILRTRFQEDKGRFSPDGKWLAYQSDESGRAEIYLQPFPPTGEKWRVSNDHGGQPQWRADGKELFYTTFTNPARMMAVDISVAGNRIRAGAPHMLFEAVLQDGGVRNRWVVTANGQEFLAVVPVNDKPVYRFTVILNWPSLLPKP